MQTFFRKLRPNATTHRKCLQAFNTILISKWSPDLLSLKLKKKQVLRLDLYRQSGHVRFHFVSSPWRLCIRAFDGNFHLSRWFSGCIYLEPQNRGYPTQQAGTKLQQLQFKQIAGSEIAFYFLGLPLRNEILKIFSFCFCSM